MKKKKETSTKLKAQIIQALLDKKGTEVVELDLRDLDSAVADYFIVCHGESTTQVGALADGVYKDVKDNLLLFPSGTEGKENGNWVVLDYFDVVVHIFHREARQNYQLEDLWSDALFVEH